MDKELLFKPRLAEEDVEVAGVGIVRVRALSRDEVKKIRADAADDDAFENALIAAAMVDPQLTADEVARWGAAAPAGELVVVMDAVQRLSGLGKEAAKSGVPGVRRRRR